MIKRFVGWFILVPLCAILVIFALANRHVVSVRFDPVSPDNPLIGNVDVPFFVVIYSMLFIGIVLGGIAVWFTQGPNRQAKRRYRREADRLTRELADARKAPRPNATDQALLDPDNLLEDY